MTQNDFGVHRIVFYEKSRLAKIYSFIFLIVSASTAAGFAGDMTNPTEEFETLLNDEPQFEQVLDWMNDKFKSLSRDEATEIVLEFEEYHLELRDNLSDKIRSYFGIGGNRAQEYARAVNCDPNKRNEIRKEAFTKKQKRLLKQVSEKKLHLGSAEGILLLKVCYEFYKQFKPYIRNDIKAYIDIMAKRTKRPPAEDAGLMISWNEAISRAVQHERFLKKYEDSPKYDRIQNQFGTYVLILFGGAANSRLSSYRNNYLRTEIKGAYRSAIARYENSHLVNKIDQFMDVLEKYDYKVTDEVDQLRQKIIDQGPKILGNPGRESN